MILCGESQQDLVMMVGRFVEVCRGRGLKVNGDESKVIKLVREKES